MSQQQQQQLQQSGSAGASATSSVMSPSAFPGRSRKASISIASSSYQLMPRTRASALARLDVPSVAEENIPTATPVVGPVSSSNNPSSVDMIAPSPGMHPAADNSGNPPTTVLMSPPLLSISTSPTGLAPLPNSAVSTASSALLLTSPRTGSAGNIFSPVKGAQRPTGAAQLLSPVNPAMAAAARPNAASTRDITSPVFFSLTTSAGAGAHTLFPPNKKFSTAEVLHKLLRVLQRCIEAAAGNVSLMSYIIKCGLSKAAYSVL
jgi:hypothetical protein